MAYKWLNIYLENRKQFLSIDKCQSAVRNISCGVPQVSTLNFLLYVNDMCNISKLVKYILFADDTKQFYYLSILKNQSFQKLKLYCIDVVICLIRIICISYIVLCLTYCVEIWGNTYPTNINVIFLLQNIVICIMSAAKSLDHTNSFFFNISMS